MYIRPRHQHTIAPSSFYLSVLVRTGIARYLVHPSPSIRSCEGPRRLPLQQAKWCLQRALLPPRSPLPATIRPRSVQVLSTSSPRYENVFLSSRKPSRLNQPAVPDRFTETPVPANGLQRGKGARVRRAFWCTRKAPKVSHFLLY